MMRIPTGETCSKCGGEITAWCNGDAHLYDGQPCQCNECGNNGAIVVGFEGGSISVAEDESETELVECWSCDGTGIACRAAMNTANVDIPCDRCKGTGECPEIMREWQDLGLKIRKVRQDKGQSLREWAHQLGVSVVKMSQAERGIIDPRCLPSANVELSHGGDKKQ